jgi:DNA invertase Pin-like site-specific DNA recombinase
MVVGYCRVSSRSQSLAMQRDAIMRAARLRPLSIQAWYEERVSSTRSRPELDRLLADVRGGRVRLVFVYRLDRLTRNGIRDTLRIVEEIRAAGATLETVADGFRLGADSDVVVAVLAWAAQMERAAISERIASARQRVEAAGGSWGRPRRVDAALEQRIREMRKTSTIRDIAIALKIPRATVSDVVSEKGAYSRPSKTAKKTGVKKARPR